MTEKLHISDESSDHKYFTVIPNYIYNHSTLWDREVYCQMKRIAGEQGTCWMSQSKLAKQCGISINRLKKSLAYLLKHEWVEYIGEKIVQTKGGEQNIHEYKIVDLWKKNVDFYESKKGVSPSDIPTLKGVSRKLQRGITDEPKGVSPGDDKEEPYKEEPYKEDIASPSDAFALSEEIVKMETSTRIDLKIIALYWRYRKPNLLTREQYEVALKRCLKTAKLLSVFTKKQITHALEKAEAEYYNIYTLETILKLVTK